MYLHEHTGWTDFTWDSAAVLPLVADVRFAQGKLLGRMSEVGFDIEARTEIRILAEETVASSEIEGVSLDAEKVRSSLARQLGVEDPHGSLDTHDVDGAVSIMLDAVKNFDEPLGHERLFGWHNALFPTGYSGLRKIHVAQYRTGDMQVVSGPVGREHVHFAAPHADDVPSLMAEFVAWINGSDQEPLLKAGIAHLWFLTVHPFDDGNGRIARALTELLLTRSDQSMRRYYSMARYILEHREDYYAVLERAQKGTSDITTWLMWFLDALLESINHAAKTVEITLEREAFWRALEGAQLNDRQRKMLFRLKGGFEGKLTTSKWAKMCKVSPDTALRDINDLVAKGILVRDKAGGRSASYLLSEEHR